jgi:glycosyltransferase involved in cell wall biosynthesis
MAERLRQAAVPPERIIRVENWADGIAIRPVPPADNPLRAVWGVADAVVVGYSGNLGRVHLAAPLVALIRTIGADEGIRFLFIGGGAQLGRLEADLARQRGRTFLCQPAQPRERLAQSLSVPDIHLVTLRPELEGAVVPSKLYGIMAAGRPTVFVGAPDGEVARTLARHGCGIAVAPDDPAGLVAAIRRLAADAEERARLGAAARQAFEQHYDRPLALAKLERALAQVPTSVPAAAAPACQEPR